MPGFAPGVAKRPNVSKLGSKNDSEFEPKNTLTSVSVVFASKRRTLRKHLFLLSQTHICRLLASTISFKSQLWNAAKNAFEKGFTKECNKTLEGSTLGAKVSKCVPKGSQLSSKVGSLFVFLLKLLPMRGSWGPRLAPEPHKGLKMEPRASKTVPTRARVQPSSPQPRRPDAKGAKNPASTHSTQVSKNIEVRRCRVSVLNIYIYTCNVVIIIMIFISMILSLSIHTHICI